ncbi:MAG: hypothetical protein ACRBN8_06945 [Nannocystales bacterium]
MRTTLSILFVCASLAACDVPKSVGDESSTTSGEDSNSSSPGTQGSSSTGAVSDSTTSGGDPTSPGGTVTTASQSTGVQACEEFDAGPVGDPDFSYSWECLCQTCELSYPDIPLETVELFDTGGMCDCLCAEAGCGFVEGEGGVGGGPEATTGDWPDTDGGASTTDSWPESASAGESSGGAAPLTVGDCLDAGGEVVGDPGDGSVFDPDYVCESGESPLGILDFEPGMPFPKNGGVCCL